jgi:acyl dehydratase
MTSTVAYSDVEVGTRIPEREFIIRRVNLLQFCSACSDFTATHWNERIAKSVGLPNVIAHGTYTIAEAVRAVSDWVGDPGAIVEYRSKFTRPVVVPDTDEGTLLRITGRVERKLDANQVLVRLSAVSPDGEALSGARALVQLAP